MSRVLSRDGKAWPAARIVRHVSELVRLAGPVIVARAGILVMAVVDVIFVGRYGTSDLAHLALGSAPFNTLVGTGAGLLIGTLVMTANAFGRGALAECGAVWQRGTIYAGLLGFAAAVRHDLRDLQPRDLIDVQSFLWVQGSDEYR